LPDALALLLTEEYAAGAPARRRALDLLLALGAGVGEARRRLSLSSGRAVSAEQPDQHRRCLDSHWTGIRAEPTVTRAADQL